MHKISSALILILLIASSAWASGETFTSTTAPGNALPVTSNATYENITVTKTGDVSSQSDDYDFKGTNAAVRASGGAVLTITGSSTKITSNATYGNAVFSYGGNTSSSSSGGSDSGTPGGTPGGTPPALPGTSSKIAADSSSDGTTINISDATITTSKNNSGGIMVTGGGILNATNLTITTEGGSSAAIRSDKGGGTMTVSGGTYTANGSGSPAIYSTAAVTVSNATLKSGVAQGIVIEGGNSVALNSCTVDANNTKLNSDNDKSYQGVLIYQSGSGDASDGSAAFSMTNGSLTNANGDVFFITNTTCTINLTGATITNNDTANNGIFLRATTGSWGTSGSNGGNVTLNASGQTIKGDMYIDSISTLTLNLKDSSTFTGAITNSSAKSVAVTVEAGSTWNLTGNSYVTSLTNNGTINKSSYTLYVNGTAYDGGTTDDGTTDDGTTDDGTTDDGTTDDGSSSETVTLDTNGGVSVNVDSSGNVTTLPSGSLASAIQTASGYSSLSSFYSAVFNSTLLNSTAKSSTKDSSSAAKVITATLDSALPYGTILILTLIPSTNTNSLIYAAMIHSGKANSSSTSLVIDTSKLYSPSNTSQRITFPAGTYQIAYSTLDGGSMSGDSYEGEGGYYKADYALNTAASGSQSGNLGSIALAATTVTSSHGDSSSGCNSGMSIFMLLPVLAFFAKKSWIF